LVCPSTRSQAFTGWQAGGGGSGLTASHALTGLQAPGVAPAVLFHPRAKTAKAIESPIPFLVRLIEASPFPKNTLFQKTRLLNAPNHAADRPTSQWPISLPYADIHSIVIMASILIVFKMYFCGPALALGFSETRVRSPKAAMMGGADQFFTVLGWQLYCHPRKILAVHWGGIATAAPTGVPLSQTERP
jgi:hypothetical protein